MRGLYQIAPIPIPNGGASGPIAWRRYVDGSGRKEFPDGQIVLLTDLFEDQEATVLQLPAQPATAAEAAAQERVALVG